jgi:uncharacterized protein YgbK (DUF1537 family)
LVVVTLKDYLIIADDFTGANDTGVQLANLGVPVHVEFAVSQLHQGSTVLDTETRNDSVTQAASKMAAVLPQIPWGQFDTVVKKVDSTLRGNISTEVRALAEAYQPDIVAFAPALPDLDRTVVNGVLRVNGKRAMKTDFAKDPMKPILTDQVTTLLQQAFPELGVAHYSLAQIRATGFTLGKAAYCSFDAENNQDLARVVSALKATGKKVLWVGSAGLTTAIMMQAFNVLPALALIGSVSEVTRAQLHAAEDNGVHLVNIPIYEAYANQTYAPYVDEALAAFAQGRDVILMSSASYQRSELDKTIKILSAHQLEADKINELTQAVLSGICRKVLQRVKVAGLFVSGGETAKGLLRIGKATGAKVLTEIAPGIPLLEIAHGDFAGMRVITKAGAFGNKDLIVYAFKKLKSRSRLDVQATASQEG